MGRPMAGVMPLAFETGADVCLEESMSPCGGHRPLSRHNEAGVVMAAAWLSLEPDGNLVPRRERDLDRLVAVADARCCRSR